MDSWYLYKNGENYGPYSLKQLQEMAKNRSLSKDDLIFQEGTDEWVKAASVKKIFKKSKKRLLKSFIVLLVIMGVVFGAYTYLDNRDSTNIVTNKSSEILKDSTSSGEAKVIEVTNGELAGLKIEIPEGAYDSNVKWEIEVSEIKEHNLGENFNPLTPIISIKNGGEYSSEPMLVTIPIDLPEGYFAMVFYYDRKTGKLEGIPTVSLNNQEIKILTRHFSDIVPSMIEKEKVSDDINIDSGFRPGVDDWQFVNRGSFIAKGGHCSGQSMSALWYYYEKKIMSGERALYGRYDNNDRGYGTIDFWRDDAWGYRLSSAVQEDVDFGSLIASAFLKMEGYNDNLTMASFAYSMLVTGEPQFLGLAESGKPGGHAIIAHRVTKDGIYVSDPNYPGEERIITYNNGKLGPYNSGTDAQAIASGNDIAFNEIGWYAKTALVSWDQVKSRFEELQEKNVGSDLFPDIKLEVYVRDETKDEDVWTSLVDNMEFASEDTAKVELYKSGERYDMTGKLIVKANPGYSDVYLKTYRGVNPIYETKTSEEFRMELELEKGVNDIGFYIYQRNGNRENFINFERLNLILDEEEIEGVYQGYMQPEETGVAVEYIIEKLVEIFAKIFNSDVTDAEMGNIIEEVEVEAVPIKLTITNYNKETGKCDINFYTLEDDGTEFEVDIVGTYKNNELKFDLKHYDGSKLFMEGDLSGEGFSGEFSITAWGFLKDAITGSWQVQKDK